MRALQGESVGPAPVVAYFPPGKGVSFKRRPEDWAFQWLSDNGIQITHLVPDVSRDFERNEVLSTWATPETIVPQDVCRFAWASHIELLRSCKPYSWDRCMAELNLQKSAGFPWRTTKEAVLREFASRGEDFLSFVRRNETQLVPVYLAFPKEELRELVDGVPKDVHQISGGEMAVHVVQTRYCGDFNDQSALLGNRQRTWYAPGMSMFHGGWDICARRLMANGKPRIFVSLDFKKNNQTFGPYMLEQINNMRRLLWDQPDDLFLAEMAWAHDGVKLLALHNGRVVDFTNVLASGSGNTTPLNTFQCRAKAVWLILNIIRDAARRCKSAGIGWDQLQLVMYVYGDNVMFSVTAKYEHLFTVENIQSVALQLNMQLTCSSSRSIEGTEFLSHRFVLRRGQYVSFPVEPRKAFVSLAYSKSVDHEVQLSRYVAQLIRMAAVDGWFQKVKQMAEAYVAIHPTAPEHAPLMWNLIQKPAAYYLQFHMMHLESGSDDAKELSPLKSALIVEALVQSGSLLFSTDDENQSCKKTCEETEGRP